MMPNPPDIVRMFWLIVQPMMNGDGGGQIFDPTDRSADTQGVKEFIRLVTEDPGWTASVVEKADAAFSHVEEKSGRVVAVLGGHGDLEVQTHCSPDGLVSLSAVAISGFRMVRVPRAWDSPERRATETDPRSDLYAIGCIAFQLVVGEPPFTGRPMQVVSAHLNRAPDRPSQRRAGIPPELDELVVEARAQVEPGSARPGAHRAARQKGVDLGAHGGGHLVTRPAHSGTEQHLDGVRPSAEVGHRGDDGRQHPRGRADPARVRGADDPGLPVGEQHGHAVGGEDGEPDRGPRGDHGVRGRVVGLACCGRCVDHDDVRAVHLLEEHDRDAQLGGQAGAVGGDRGRVVADARGQVEGAVDAAGPPARAGADDPPDARRTRAAPMIAPQLRLPR
jgi:hypothetical protein